MGRCGLNREEGMGFGPQGLQRSRKDRRWWWRKTVASDSATPQTGKAIPASHHLLLPVGSVSCPSSQVRLG